MLFSKPEYQTLTLPLRYFDDPEEFDAGVISLEVSSVIQGEERFCCACYNLKKGVMYDNGEYEQIIDLLRNNQGKPVKVQLKLKKGKVKGFKIDLDSMAEAYQDERLKTLELLGWGLNDKSFVL